jgi:hypothetical protein
MTVTVELCRRPCFSVAGTRCTRCVPTSPLTSSTSNLVSDLDAHNPLNRCNDRACRASDGRTEFHGERRCIGTADTGMDLEGRHHSPRLVKEAVWTSARLRRHAISCERIGFAARRDGHNDRIMVDASHMTAVKAADTLNVSVQTVIALFGSSDRIRPQTLHSFEPSGLFGAARRHVDRRRDTRALRLTHFPGGRVTRNNARCRLTMRSR